MCVFPQADREALEHVLHALMPLVNVAFFTLIGASLNLGAIAKTLHIAVLIVVVRPPQEILLFPLVNLICKIRLHSEKGDPGRGGLQGTRPELLGNWGDRGTVAFRVGWGLQPLHPQTTLTLFPVTFTNGYVTFMNCVINGASALLRCGVLSHYLLP